MQTRFFFLMENGVKPFHIGTPDAEFAIDEGFVSQLLVHQHADLAHLPLRAVDAGWDNMMFRLGDRLAVRLPRRAAAAKLIVHEQHWLPDLAEKLSLPVPAPYRIGKPALGYPWSWSVLPWLNGSAADQSEPQASQAVRLARFLRSLHVPAPANAPTNPIRGGPLRQRAPAAEVRLKRLQGRSDLITPRIWHIWNKALEAPLDGPLTWLHGDLHPRNVLVDDGIITGIIDWGDLTSGDCATDLASIWMLFADVHAQQEVLAAYANASDATVQRARGWAVLFGLTLLDTGLTDNPRNAALGMRILRRVAGGE
jgi:aminoglycoside phosphotransferase (APT) family kinase protein